MICGGSTSPLDLQHKGVFVMAEIKINAGVWSSVSDEDKAKITEIMRKTNLISEGDSFSPDVSLTKETPVRSLIL